MKQFLTKAAILLPLFTLTGGTVPGHSQNKGEDHKKGYDKLSENLQIIHHNEINQAITDTLIQRRVERTDSLLMLIDTTTTP